MAHPISRALPAVDSAIFFLGRPVADVAAAGAAVVGERERALRAVALGRKNFLFAGSDCGGERAAAMYSLVGSAKLNGLDPERYLRTVLARIADHPVSHIQDLLPWNLAPTLLGHAAQAA